MDGGPGRWARRFALAPARRQWGQFRPPFPVGALQRRGPEAGGRPASSCSGADAGCRSLGYTTSQLAYLLVGEVVDG
jgi:hypothetical protein